MENYLQEGTRVFRNNLLANFTGIQQPLEKPEVESNSDESSIDSVDDNEENLLQYLDLSYDSVEVEVDWAQPIFEGAKHSLGSLVHQLLNFMVKSKASYAQVQETINLMRSCAPEENIIPTSWYKFSTIIKDASIPFKKIPMCPGGTINLTKVVGT